MARPARVAPRRATAVTTERGVNRSRTVTSRSGTGPYSTGVVSPTGAIPPDSGRRRPTVEYDLDWRSVLVFLGAFVALVALGGLIRSAPRTLTTLAVATMLALALNPVVTLVERRARVRRAVAVALVLTGFSAAVAVIALLLVPPAVRQARDLSAELPQVVAELRDLPVVGDQLAEARVPEKIQQWVEDLPERLRGDTAPIEDAGRTLADGLLAGVTTLLFAITLLLDGDRIVRGFRRLVPERRRALADRAGELAYEVVGRYISGSLLVAGIAGIAVLAAGTILGVPLTPLAAVWVALWDLVPQIGGAAGGIPFVLLAVTEGPTTGLAAAVFFILYLQIENHILGPLIVGQAVKLSPPATMTAALIGVSAAGVVGALIAVPLTGAVKAVYLEFRRRRPPDAAATVPE